MKDDLSTFPKATFPVSQMTSAELLDHILKLVNWKSRVTEQLQQLKQKAIERGETDATIKVYNEFLGENPQ